MGSEESEENSHYAASLKLPGI